MRPGACQATEAPALVACLAALVLACSTPSESWPRVELSLPQVYAAQQQLDALKRRFRATNPYARRSLRNDWVAFVENHPDDPSRRQAALHVALLDALAGQGALAQAWLELSGTEPPHGPDRDLAELVRAVRARVAGETSGTYESLMRLEGQLVDPDLRLLCLDQMVLAALETARPEAAVSHIESLVALSAATHREAVWPVLESRLEEVPLSVLEQHLRQPASAVRGGAAPSGRQGLAARRWLQSRIRTTLARSALSSEDSDLAQRLLDTGGAPSNTSVGSQLRRLATQAAQAAWIDPSHVGLLLERQAGLPRQRSADCLLGVQAELEAQPQVRLVLRQTEAETPQSVSRALGALTADGCGVLIAGLSESVAREAASFATANGVPLILLHPPGSDAPGGRGVVWRLGEDAAALGDQLATTLGAAGAPEPTRIGGRHGVCHGWTPEPPVRYGFGRSLVVEGGRPCAEALAAEGQLSGAAVGLSLDAWASQIGDAADQVWTMVPQHTQLNPIEERWFEALGRDGVTLALQALSALPEPVRDAAEVQRSYAALNRALGAPGAEPLRTAPERRFESSGQLIRRWKARPVGLAERGQP